MLGSSKTQQPAEARQAQLGEAMRLNLVYHRSFTQLGILEVSQALDDPRNIQTSNSFPQHASSQAPSTRTVLELKRKL